MSMSKFTEAPSELIKRRTKVSDSGCWEWQGALNATGYGQLTYQGKHLTAHRFSYTHLVEPIREGFWILHHCDNRICVNPEHLYQGTPINNRADMLERSGWSHPWGKRIACTKGHPYEEGSYRINKTDGSRECRICNKEHKRAYRANKKAGTK